MSGSGLYDNQGHGILVEGMAAITHTDILCNQQSAVSATGHSQLQLDNCRLYAGSEYAVTCTGNSHGEVTSCIVYQGSQKEMIQVYYEITHE